MGYVEEFAEAYAESYSEHGAAAPAQGRDHAGRGNAAWRSFDNRASAALQSLF